MGETHGYIHRDISCENIMLARDTDDKLHARLMDFGQCIKVQNGDAKLKVDWTTWETMAGKQKMWSEEMCMIWKYYQNVFRTTGQTHASILSLKKLGMKLPSELSLVAYYDGWKADTWAIGLVLLEFYFRIKNVHELSRGYELVTDPANWRETLKPPQN